MIGRKILVLSILLSIVFLGILPIRSYVNAQCERLKFPGGVTVKNPIVNCDLVTPAGFISAFLNPIFGIAGFLTVIFIVISGIQFILSSGNPEAAAGAKNRLIYALVGFALIVLAFAILQIVNRLFLGPTGVA